MEQKMMQMGDLAPNDSNPREISGTAFKKLKDSIKEFPEMLSVRPIIVNKEGTIIAGNMRYRACLELGYTEVLVTVADLSVKKTRELLLKDNHYHGRWDEDMLAEYYAEYPFDKWGLDVMMPVPDMGNNAPEEENEEEEDNNKGYEPDKLTILCPYCGTEFEVDDQNGVY